MGSLVNLAPATGEDTERVIDDAIETLGTLRSLPWLGDAGATLHLLTSLIAEAQHRLPRAVADARDQDYSWAQTRVWRIGCLSGGGRGCDLVVCVGDAGFDFKV
jgi:hypothetical protein